MACAMVWPWAGPSDERPEHEEVERALQQVALGGVGASRHAPHVTPLEILVEGSRHCRCTREWPAKSSLRAIRCHSTF